MSFRVRLFLIHLASSSAVLGLVLGAMYFGWYYWPNWYLMGAGTIAGLMVMVDVGLGPLATLVVSNPSKPSKELRRDIALIVLVQLAAFAYGAFTLWSMRPVFYVFSLDRAEIVSAAAFHAEDVDGARASGSGLLPSFWGMPTWVWAPLPDDLEERATIVSGALSTGKDVTSMPQYFRPMAEAGDALRQQLLPLEKLRDSKVVTEAEFERRLVTLGSKAEDLAYLPLQARERDGSAIFDRKTLKLLDIWPFVVWPQRK